MKILKYTYIPLVLAAALLFVRPVEASETFVSTSASVTGGTTLTVTTEQWVIDGEMVEVEDVSGTYQRWMKWDPTYNITLSGVNQQWLNGYLQVTIQITNSDPLEIDLTGHEIINVHEDGLTSYIIPIDTAGKFRVMVFFDNYYNRSNNISLGQIILHYVAGASAYSAAWSETFTTSISTYAANIEKTSVVQNDRLSAILYSAITQADGPLLTSIDQWTNYIYNKTLSMDVNLGTLLTDLQSYITFMNTYIPNLSSINTNTQNTYNQLVLIYTYTKNRATIQNDIKKSRIQYSNGVYTYRTDNNQRSMLISRDMNIEYVYINGFSTNNGNIFYFENDPTTTSGATVYPTRVIKLSAGEQYYPIEFKYNEHYVFFNLGATGYGDEIFKAYIGDGYEYQALLYYIEYVMNMNAQQSSAAAELESEYADRDNQSSQILSGLNSVNMPSLSGSDLDILASTNTTQKNNFFGLIALITHNGLITTILITVITAAIAGFILYGKRD